MPTIHLAHSPDSDDAFMFYALAAQKIPTGDRSYVHELADIETLNQRAMKGELDVTAVSIHAYAYLADSYALLPNGSSMGDRYGPRVVANTPVTGDVRQELKGKRVAIPGALTTAALALRLYQPEFEPVVIPFDHIESAVADGDVDAGVLIHEGQLTYTAQGLHLWLDLGDWWFSQTGLPLPLGGNVVRRDLGDDVMLDVSRDLRASIVYGLEHRDEALAHAMQYARDLDRAQADQFVGMYVNDYTIDYGDKGRRAVRELLHRAAVAGLIPNEVEVVFVGDNVRS
jgi:1,4-dihydroxy-6-naphthoate synthase